MARTSAIEYADVAEVCSALFLAGKSVGLPAVYASIGSRGSTRVIQGYIERWRKETAEKLTVTLTNDLPGVPDAVAGSVRDLVLQIWQGALVQADETLQVARREIEREREELEAERERNAATLAHLEGSLLETRTMLQERDQQVADLKGAYQDKDGQLLAANAQSTAQREEIARLSATLEAVQSQHADQLAAAQARGEEILAEARRQHQAELEAADIRHTGDRQHLMATTDALRTAARTTETELREQLQASKAFSDSYRMRAGNLENELSKWRGRCEAAEGLLERLTTKRRKPALAVDCAAGAQA